MHSNKAQKFAGGCDGAAGFRLPVRPILSASQEIHMWGKVSFWRMGQRGGKEMDRVLKFGTCRSCLSNITQCASAYTWIENTSLCFLHFGDFVFN